MFKPENIDGRVFLRKNITTSTSAIEKRSSDSEIRFANVVPETGDDLVLTDGIYEVRITGILRGDKERSCSNQT